MKTPAPTPLRLLEDSPFLRRLDRVPFPGTLLIGAAIGLAVSTATYLQPSAMAFATVAVVIGLAGALAWSAQPVGVWDRAVATVPSFLDMVAIAGGTFVMGSPVDEPGRRPNEKQHPVTLSPFEISRTAVTRAQYQEIMEIEKAPGPGGDDHPVTKVSWFDAAAFCNRLSELDGLKPCYRIKGKKVEWVEDAGGYRLPTEAEWEYAARAGSEGRWPASRWRLKSYAWFASNSRRHSQPVASLRRNRYGLHDMHGNVWEWSGTATPNMTWSLARTLEALKRPLLRACFAGAPSSSSPGTCAPRTGAGAGPSSRTSSSAFVVFVAPAASIDQLSH